MSDVEPHGSTAPVRLRPWGVTSASLGVLGSAAVPSLARRVAELGYRSFWAAEANGTEAFSVLGAAGAAATLDLGTGVIPVQLRTPPLAAMGAATLQGLVPDRDGCWESARPRRRSSSSGTAPSSATGRSPGCVSTSPSSGSVSPARPSPSTASSGPSRASGWLNAWLGTPRLVVAALGPSDAPPGRRGRRRGPAQLPARWSCRVECPPRPRGRATGRPAGRELHGLRATSMSGCATGSTQRTSPPRPLLVRRGRRLCGQLPDRRLRRRDRRDPSPARDAGSGRGGCGGQRRDDRRHRHLWRRRHGRHRHRPVSRQPVSTIPS